MGGRYGKRPPGCSPAGAKDGFDIRQSKTEARYTAARLQRQALNDNSLEAALCTDDATAADLFAAYQQAVNQIDGAEDMDIVFKARRLGAEWERAYLAEHPS